METNNTPFRFSFGINTYDVMPAQCISPSWPDFCHVFDSTRAPKKGMYQITAPMGGDGRRCKANALPRNWVAFDLDGGIVNGVEKPLSDGAFSQIWLGFAALAQGLMYETASSAAGARRARFVLSLDAEVSRDDAQRLCLYIEGLLPAGGYWDRSVYRAEQPLFLPPEDVDVIHFGDQPLSVEETLGMIPPPPPPKVWTAPPPKALGVQHRTAQSKIYGLILPALQQLGLHVKHKGAGQHDILCPWGNEHSDGRYEAAYFEPSGSNGGMGGFKCLHSHCEHRHIGHLLTFVERCAGVRHAA